MNLFKRAAVGGALTLGLFAGIAPVASAAPASVAPASAASVGQCSVHMGNTAAWADCKSIRGEQYWVRLETECKNVFNRGTTWKRTKWKLVKANQTLTVKHECRKQVVNAQTKQRAF
jgi:hypothetical protein